MNYNSLTQDAQGHHSTQKLKVPKSVGSSSCISPENWDENFILYVVERPLKAAPRPSLPYSTLLHSHNILNLDMMSAVL